MRRLLHHVIAHPLLVLCPALGVDLHARTVPDADHGHPAIDILAAVGLAVVVLVAPQVIAALLLSCALKRLGSW